MEDYYCTKCGADLERQPGFDPNKGYWVCRNCGELLTDPGVYSEFERFEGVSWFCDRCGAFLNKQLGFSYTYDSWICTECGCYNRISEDEIKVSDREDDINSASSSGFTKFNSVLNHLNKGIEAIASITGVDLDSDTVEDDDEYEDDTEDEDDDEYKDYETVREATTFNGFVDSHRKDLNKPHWYQNSKHTESDNNPRILTSEYLKPERGIFEQELETDAELMKQCRESKNKAAINSARRKKIWRTITRKKQIPNIASVDCVGKPYEQVVKILEEQEFSNIKVLEDEDLGIDEISQENTVKSISINDMTEFDSKTSFPYGARIIITYHQVKRAATPFSSKGVRRLEYDDVVWGYKNAGFRNITFGVIHDLKTGVLIKDGSVESVSIGGKTRFKRKDLFRIDVPIVITYHTFRDNDDQ